MSLPQPPTADSIAYRRKLIRPTVGRRVKWRTEVVLYTLVESALRLLPSAAVAGLGRLLGAMAHRFLPRRRAVVARNLRIAFGRERSAGELQELNLEVFRRAGANLLGSLRTAGLDNAGLADAVEVKDEHIFMNAMAEQRGVVVVLAHMGNWEALAQWFPRLMPPGRKGATVYRPLNNPVMNARVVASRARRGLSLFSKDDSPLAMATFLREGGALGVLSDQRAGSGGELVPFFGRLTSSTPIPSVLARRTHSAVIGVSLRTVRPGKWELKLHSLEGEPTTGNVMNLLERVVRESPADVFWLQDRWKVNARNPHVTSGKPIRAGAAPAIDVSAKPRRALVWLEVGGPVCAPPAGRPADLVYEYSLPAGAPRPDGLPPEAIVHVRAPERRLRVIAGILLAVDRSDPLPLDFVYSPDGDRKLMAVGRELGIAVIFPEEVVA